MCRKVGTFTYQVITVKRSVGNLHNQCMCTYMGSFLVRSIFGLQIKSDF